MTTASSSLAPTRLGPQLARRLLGVLASPLGLLMVLAVVRNTPNIFSRGVVILGPILFSRTRR
jgi:hypothetical protein